jgi:hypothetical protein
MTFASSVTHSSGMDARKKSFSSAKSKLILLNAVAYDATLATF